MTSKSYQNFIGVDIGKFEIAIAVHGSKQSYIFENNPIGWKSAIKELKTKLKDALVVLEATGGYELGLVLFLQKLKIDLHRANTKQVKNFIRSLGRLAKTDKLDALALAHYGSERHSRLQVFPSVSQDAFKLYEIVQRRLDLKKMIVQEKNRAKAPRCDGMIKESCRCILDILEEQVKIIDQHLQALIDSMPVLKERQMILETIEGIGSITARELVCLIPELGTLSHKQVASLAGLAPHPNESGTFKGHRSIKGGRKDVRNALFMAAMAARNTHDSKLRVFYERLIAKGKKPIVALTAVMRKIIVIANARIKELIYSKSLIAIT